MLDRCKTCFKDNFSLQKEFNKEGVRIWNFLSEAIILRDSHIPNRYQTLVKRESVKNITTHKEKKDAAVATAKEDFKR